MPHRIPKQTKPGPELQTAVLDEARERARQLQQPNTARKTDQSVTPPYGDPERAHLRPNTRTRTVRPRTITDQIADIEEEGPGPAEGHTDNRAGG